MIKMLQWGLLGFCLLSLACVTSSAQKTLSTTTTDSMTIASDEYEWLEQDSSRLRDWVELKSRSSKSTLQSLSIYSDLKGELEELNERTTVIGEVKIVGGGLLYLATFPGDAQNRLMYLGNSSDPIEIFNPSKSPGISENRRVMFFDASSDGRFIAVAVTEIGDERSIVYVIDRISRKILPHYLPLNDYRSIRFTPDGLAFTYQKRFTGGSQGRRSQVYLHRIFEDHQRDQLIFTCGKKVDQSSFCPGSSEVSFLHSSKVALAITSSGTTEPYKILWKPIRHLSNQGEWRDLVNISEGFLDYAINENAIFLATKTADDLSSGFSKILFNTDDSFVKRRIHFAASEVLPRAIYASKNLLIVQARKKDLGVLLLKDLKSGFEVLKEEKSGTEVVEIYSAPYSTRVLMKRQSFSHSPVFAEINASQTYERLNEVLNADSINHPIEVLRFEAVSHDGVRVPYLVVKDKETILSSKTPALMWSYAAYGVSLKPALDVSGKVWFNRKGIRVYCMARGGGELGQDWHDQGRKKNKINAVKDTIACAQDLIVRGFTSNDKIALYTGSAGGAIVGGVLKYAPELFKAIVVNAGVLNLSKLQNTQVGPANVSEFGDIKNPDEAIVLRSLDAFENLVPGVKYPSILVIHGFNDVRVPVWMSAKFFAKFESLNEKGHPALFLSDFEQGHGLDSGRGQRVKLWSKIYPFLLWQLNVPPPSKLTMMLRF